MTEPWNDPEMRQQLQQKIEGRPDNRQRREPRSRVPWDETSGAVPCRTGREDTGFLERMIVSGTIEVFPDTPLDRVSRAGVRGRGENRAKILVRDGGVKKNREAGLLPSGKFRACS